MSDLIVIENTNLEIIEVAPRMEVTPQFNNTYQEFIGEMDDRVDDAAIYASNAANSAGQASGYKDAAAGSAAASANSASQAADFVGTTQNIPHGHVTGSIAVDPDFQRLSDAYDEFGKRYEYNQRIWDATNGTLIEEGTTNLLPAGAEGFVTGWTNGTGETCTVTDYPVNIPGIGDVIAKRITGNGLGSSPSKYRSPAVTVGANHTCATSCYVMRLGSTDMYFNSGYGNLVTVTTVMQRLVSIETNVAVATIAAYFHTANASDILDIVVYAPQIEAKSYATSYTPPGTTRAAESLSIPVNAYRKNLLTLNQATGGDALGDTTGFTAVNGATVTRDTTEAWQGTGSIKVVTPNAAINEGVRVDATTIVAGKIYAKSVRIKGSGTLNVFMANQSGTARGTVVNVTLTSSWQTITAIGAMISGDTHATVFLRTDVQQAATFYIDGLQLEEGTTASDWALPEVDYSNALIDPAQPFSIEFDAVPWVDDKSGDRYLFEFVSGSSVFAVYTNVTSGYYRFYHINGGSTRSILSSVAVVAGVKKTHKISVSGGTVTYVIDGATINTTIFDGMPSLLGLSMFMGSRASGAAHRNASFSNVRIRKGVALTAAELAYTGKLLPDEYTTFFSDMKESISSRPFVRKNGQAQNVVLAGDSPNQNAIINGDFRLASRGTNFSNPTSNIFDGMLISANGTGATYTVSQESFPAGQQELVGATKFGRLAQTVAPTGQTTFSWYGRIEDVETYNGQKCMFYVALRGNSEFYLPGLVLNQNFGSGGSAGVDIAVSGRLKVNTKLTIFAFPVTLPSTAGKTIGAGNRLSWFISLPLNTAFTLDIADLALKPTNASTQYYRRDIQVLQQFGNRTLQKLPTNLQLRAVNVQTNYIDFESVVLPTEMRATPALSGTYAETTNWKVLNTAAVQTTGFTLALLNASANQVAFRATKNAHGLTDATLQLVTNVLLSAEL